MISIWPPNRSLPAGLAGNRAFVFPFEWPVSCPPQSSSKVGSSKRANYYIEPLASNTRRRILLKNFQKEKNIFAIASGFWTKYNRKMSAAVSRLVSEACSTVVHGWWYQVISISPRILLSPLVWPENTILSFCDHFFILCLFLALSAFSHSPSSDWAVGLAWRQVLVLAATTYLIRKRPLWP